MDPITNLADLQAAIDFYFTTPRVPRVTGAETNAVLRAMVQILTGAGVNPDSQVIHNYLSALPAYGPGRVLLSDFTWGSFNQTYPFLPAPEAFTFGTPTQNAVAVSWSAVANADNYILQRDITDQFTSAVTLYIGAGTSFPVTGLAPGTLYYFRVKAISANYQDSPYLSDSIATTAPAAGQLAHINLGNTGHIADEAGWVNFLLDDWINSTNGWSAGTSPVFDDLAGAPTGWTLKFESSGEGLGSGTVTLGTPAPDFPNDVTTYKWFNIQNTAYYPMTLTFFGLTPGNVYDITTLHFDNVELDMEMKWGDYEQDGDQGGDGGTLPLEYFFPNMPADENGQLTGHLNGFVEGQVAINGLIIKEKPVTFKAAYMVTNSYDGLVYQGWNSLSKDTLNTAVPLSAINGTSLGWSVTVAATEDIGFLKISIIGSSDDFPQTVCQQQWDVDSGDDLTFTISGLDTAKLYTIKTCHGDENWGADRTVNVTCNGSAAQSGDPKDTIFFLEFDNISPDGGGTIEIVLSSPDGSPVINALIVAEN